MTRSDQLNVHGKVGHRGLTAQSAEGQNEVGREQANLMSSSALSAEVRLWRVPTEQPAGVKKLLYTKREAAFALGISVRSIDYLIATKQLEARRIGGRV